MGLKLPAPTEELIAALQQVGRYLDRMADISPTDRTHITARLNANTVWQAARRIEELGELVEELLRLNDPTRHDVREARHDRQTH